MRKFKSEFDHVGSCFVPNNIDLRVMMMPIILGDMQTVPDYVWWKLRDTIKTMFGYFDPKYKGQVGYLTVDCQDIKAGDTHRRAGLHVDGVLDGKCGAWGGGGGGGWGSAATGMLTVSSSVGCRAWKKTFKGVIGNDGECDSMIHQAPLIESTPFLANEVYWVHGLCVHESMPQKEDVNRTFVRLSLPSKAPWFEGYTTNPMGIKPTGPIYPQRKYMSEVS